LPWREGEGGGAGREAALEAEASIAAQQLRQKDAVIRSLTSALSQLKEQREVDQQQSAEHEQVIASLRAQLALQVANPQPKGSGGNGRQLGRDSPMGSSRSSPAAHSDSDQPPPKSPSSANQERLKAASPAAASAEAVVGNGKAAAAAAAASSRHSRGAEYWEIHELKQTVKRLVKQVGGPIPTAVTQTQHTQLTPPCYAHCTAFVLDPCSSRLRQHT
jgi:hypothetical protein